MTTLEYAEVGSPVGVIAVAATEKGVCGLFMSGGRARLRAELERRFGQAALEPSRDPAGSVTAIRRYLKGDLRALDRLRVDAGGTSFQKQVWSALRSIPPGETRSYADVARAVGRPKAVRAVARANATNPVSLIVPCHRVIRSDGSLGGYGGGIEKKAWLLRHEGADSGSARRSAGTGRPGRGGR
jgi:O-6-methylguanine DNA methyltransferase